jgi:uncharacterized protein YeaO (DUF488 family)
VHYFAELDANKELVGQLLDKAKQNRLTLLFSARDTDLNQAVALKKYLMIRSGVN